MENGVTKQFSTAIAETANTNSTDTFQSFIYDLFEKNGILNDLRAYLRGHIVNVLKSAQTGDPLVCQRNFTQRLGLTSQALNMLIAEYLLRLEFSYSFSVFVSEIPLANMVFEFAKTLMEKSEEDSANMRFRDSDVWSILNYIGVQCDSEHASSVVEMYRNDKCSPLLLCILKCLPMYKDAVNIQPVSSAESLTSVRSIDSIYNKSETKNPPVPDNCKHYAFCSTCQNRVSKVKDKYKAKKKCLAKNIKEGPEDPFAMENLIKNIGVMEKSLIEEMFQQLKSVYESEVEMVKADEENRVKRSLATHALQLQKKRDEMEEVFKAREADLERNVQQKKRFLWGLARALREQHQHMTRAMHDVKAETQLLTIKEDSLRSQLAEAEQILKKRGEEMRQQIANELSILEGHLESMKKERENITKERSELDHLKNLQDNSSKVIKIHNLESDHINSHYELLRNELTILKKYLESSRLAPKCVIERGMMTEPLESANLNLLNNQAAEKSSKVDDIEDRLKTNQVVNDFKKKNVNFSQSHLDEIYLERSHEPARSSGSSEAGDTAADFLSERNRYRELIQRLTEENERLKAYAVERRQREQQSAAPPSRPRTAPAAAPARHALYNVTTSASVNTVSVGWRKGAGEELSLFSNAQPRILVPGDTLPFIGVLRDRHGNARRPLAWQARVGRGRGGALAGVSKKSTSPLRDRLALGAGNSGLRLTSTRTPFSRAQAEDQIFQNIREKLQQRARPALSLEINRDPRGDPNTLLWDVNDRLRISDSDKGSPPLIREKSPNAVLRDAKLRLRKLEIEAEAVEKSYLDYRRRQSALRLQRAAGRPRHDAPDAVDIPTLEVKRIRSLEKQKQPARDDVREDTHDQQKYMRSDFDKYFREYRNKLDIRQTHFSNKPTVADKVKPIPEAYSQIKDDNDCTLQGNYLETPLTEFRKLYTSARQVRKDEEDSNTNPINNSDSTSIGSEKHKYQPQTSTRNESLRKAQHNKQAELEILKQNISKMYNLQTELIRSEAHDQHNTQTDDENLLRVEVESISEVNNIKSQAQDLLLVVQSTVNTEEVQLAENDAHSDIVSAQMTIIVSPKRSIPPKTAEEGLCPKLERPRRSESPEQAAHLTRNDVLDAIFHANPNNHISSVQMQLELSKDSISEYAKGEEFADDFSVDVDNYNSRSDYDNSPISQPKTSEDENFWDS